MKTAIVRLLFRLPVSLRSAWLISRAWRPMWLSPISPSISARGTERGDRVDHEHVERARADQHVGDLERLLPRVGLGDEEVVDVDADGRGVHRVHRVLGVDVGADATVALRLGDDVGGQRRLARRLRAVDLDDPAPREPADAEREVEGEGARRHRLDPDVAPFAEPHDRALAELLLDLAERHVERLVTDPPWILLDGRALAASGSGEVAVGSTLRRGWDINTWCSSTRVVQPRANTRSTQGPTGAGLQPGPRAIRSRRRSTETVRHLAHPSAAGPARCSSS